MKEKRKEVTTCSEKKEREKISTENEKIKSSTVFFYPRHALEVVRASQVSIPARKKKESVGNGPRLL